MQQGIQMPDVAKVLKGINFPADKNDLVQHARSQHADNQVLDMLKHIPPGAYDSIAQVMSRLGASGGIGDALKGFGKPH